jgi:hypothetical protein
MNAETETEKTARLMAVFDRHDSSLKLGAHAVINESWVPVGELEENTYAALISETNRAALKGWYANLTTINRNAEEFRRILEQRIGEELPLGRNPSSPK